MKERERERERNKGRYFQIDTVVNTEGRGGVPNYKYANSTVFIQRQRKNYQTRPHLTISFPPPFWYSTTITPFSSLPSNPQENYRGKGIWVFSVVTPTCVRREKEWGEEEWS